MAKQIPNVDILTETFDTWVNRTNSIIDIVGSEVITANTTMGVTGSSTNLLNARLWGSFTSNNIAAATSLTVSNTLSANSSRIVLSGPIQVSGSVGAPGQVLTSTGSGINWSSTTTNWSNPGAIGSETPNSGVFTTVKADSYSINNTSTDDFLLNSSILRTKGTIDVLTPGNGLNVGAVKIRARGTGRASLQFTNENGQVEYGYLSVDSSGNLYWPSGVHINTKNATGSGLVLSDDGDFVDLNNGYGSFRFTEGVSIHSGNKTGNSVIRLKSNGTIEAAGNIFSGGNKTLVESDLTSYVKLTDFTQDFQGDGWCRLPNGLVIQWGSFLVTKDQYKTTIFPTAFTSFSRVVVSGGYIDSGYQDNTVAVISCDTTSFATYSAANVSRSYNAFWIAVGY